MNKKILLVIKMMLSVLPACMILVVYLVTSNDPQGYFPFMTAFIGFIISFALCLEFGLLGIIKEGIRRHNDEILQRQNNSQDELDNAYKLVYNDLCKKHSHVIALHNGTLHKDDILPNQNQVNEMILYIVNHGSDNYEN